LQGGPVRLWGFVDHGNLYGDGRAKRVLAEWWSGYGPDADTWRFDLKGEADDPVGRSPGAPHSMFHPDASAVTTGFALF
jgi:hypothetical protein